MFIITAFEKLNNNAARSSINVEMFSFIIEKSMESDTKALTSGTEGGTHT